MAPGSLLLSLPSLPFAPEVGLALLLPGGAPGSPEAAPLLGPLSPPPSLCAGATAALLAALGESLSWRGYL